MHRTMEEQLEISSPQATSPAVTTAGQGGLPQSQSQSPLLDDPASRRKQRLKWTKRVLVTSLVLALSVTLAVMVVLYMEERDKTWPKPPVQAQTHADRITSMIDWSANPCEDFHQFICGGWDPEVNESVPRIVAGFSEISDRVRQQQLEILKANFPFITTFYDGCMRPDDVELSGVDSLKPWFALTSQPGTVEEYLRVLGAVHRHDFKTKRPDSAPLFTPVVIPDPVIFRLVLYPHGLSLAELSEDTFRNMFALFNETGLYPLKDEAHLESLSRRVRVFENRTSALFPNEPEANQTLISVSEFASKTGFPIADYLEGLGDATLTGGRNHGDDGHAGKPITEVHVPQMPYFARLNEFLRATFNETSDLYDPEAAKAFLSFRVAVTMLDVLPLSFRRSFIGNKSASAIEVERHPLLAALRSEHTEAEILEYYASLEASSQQQQQQQHTDPFSTSLRTTTTEQGGQDGTTTLLESLEEKRSKMGEYKRKTERFPWKLPTPVISNLEDKSQSAFPAEADSSEESLRKRAVRCRQQAIKFFADFLAHAWVVKDFPDANRAAGETLVERLHTQMGKRIQEATWLDAETREQALTKWQLMAKNVGYNTDWITYVDLAISGHLFPDITAVRSFYKGRDLFYVGTAVKRDSFPTVGLYSIASYMDQNAFYFMPFNSINMLAGLMLAPMFDAEQPDLLNLAAYGYVAGHEITHGFDSSGRNYNGTGFHVNWWSDEANKKFKERATCLVNQYNTFNHMGFPVNGEKTLGENIADLGGLHLAWRAYKELPPQEQLHPRLTNDQLFWVYSGQVWCEKTTKDYAKLVIEHDTHAPGKFRINGPMSNLPAFAQTWGCSPSQPMGRSLTSERCELW